MYQSPLMLGLYSPEEDLSTPTHNHAHIHVYPGAHPCTYAHTHAQAEHEPRTHLCTPTHKCTHPHTPHTQAYLHTPHKYPLTPLT